MKPDLNISEVGEGLRLISYDGGTAMRSRSAMAAITPLMFSAAFGDNVSLTETSKTITRSESRMHHNSNKNIDIKT